MDAISIDKTPVCNRRNNRFATLLAFGLAAVLAGCGGGITRIELDPATPLVCDASGQVCGVEAGTRVAYKVFGRGTCESVGIKFGDGATAFCTYWDFGDQGTNPCVVRHTYNSAGWPGPKTVHAYSAAECVGEQKLQQNVLHERGSGFAADYRLALRQPVGTACNDVPGTTPLRKNTRVTVTANPDPAVRINFGCFLGGCIHNADGEPNSVAPLGFPAPGKRKFSLVLRVGSQEVQGGTMTEFVTTQRGPLQVCVNDNVLADNTGAWGITLSIDESQAE